MSPHRYAADVSDFELAEYQRAVRLLLRHPLITGVWPDEKALRRVRRFGGTLSQDLATAFGYRLELQGATARLVRTHDAIDPTRPAQSRSDRPFDRRRYAYLSLCLAVLGRAGIQITLSELADAVIADAQRIPGLGLDPDQGSDRRALVDAIGWLEQRGALRVADGSSSAWASDPANGEALYDVAREVLAALFRPPRVLQHLESVTALLARLPTDSQNARRRAAAQAARRAVVERPVVYFPEVSEAIGNHLRGSALAADLNRLTGLTVERRAEGVLLVDTASLSGERFPGTGSVAQAALFLTVAMAGRATDPDGRRVRRMDPPDAGQAQRRLSARIDSGLPAATLLLADDVPDHEEDDPGPDAGRLPLITETFLRESIADLLSRYGSAFGAAWHADPERLRAEATALLERFGVVLRVPGGVLVQPLAGRYRDTVVAVRAARPLF